MKAKNIVLCGRHNLPVIVHRLTEIQLNTVKFEFSNPPISTTSLKDSIERNGRIEEANVLT